jgi:hypothetical protein
MQTVRSFVSTFLVITLLGAGLALADKSSLKANISAARERVVKMIKGEGDTKTLIAEIDALTPKIESEVDSVPGLRPVWDKFKDNRDNKIVPAFNGKNPGGKEAAVALATGEQKKLFEEMMALLQ